MKTLVFAGRNFRELLRDPLSYIFCLGFPVIMLTVMTIINKSIPPEANMTIFSIENLSSGISVFGMTFVMLFTALQISKDRCGAFLTRLYASPMKPYEFIIGYTIPIIIIAVVQCFITYTASYIISLIIGNAISISGIFISSLVLIPSEIMFIGFGLLFGSIFNDKSAPALCSILISLSCILGGIWLDVESLSGGLKKICQVLPFWHAVRTGRMSLNNTYDRFGESMLIVCIYAVVIYLVSITVFRIKMKNDQK